MKPINKDEIFDHFSGFLKARGVEIKDGSYKQAVQTGCNFLTEAINMTQESVKRAKSEMDRQLDQMRQVIHEKTAPKPPVSAAPPKAAPKKSGARKRSKPSASRKTSRK